MCEWRSVDEGRGVCVGACVRGGGEGVRVRGRGV